MARPVKIGIIGSGVISGMYLTLQRHFPGIEIVACSDILPAASHRRAAEFGVRDLTVDRLLADEEIEVVLNLTPPQAHFDVSLSILSAGKHAYSEKPLGVDARQAFRLVREAEQRGLMVGGAPDTFLGAGMQTGRRLLDKGVVGRVIAGTAQVMSHGMEAWHPNPAFFFKPGGGPIFDVGPYYLAALVSILGPVKAVTAMATKGFAERLVTSAPHKGERIKVTTPTTINSVLEFASGAQVTLGGSWDVWRHGHVNPIELYGSEGSMLLPDPNYFAGAVSYNRGRGEFVSVDTSGLPFATPNWPVDAPRHANYRLLGTVDMIDAVRRGREPRVSGRFAAHLVDVMESILLSAKERQVVKVRSTAERPPILTAAEARRFAGHKRAIKRAG